MKVDLKAVCAFCLHDKLLVMEFWSHPKDYQNRYYDLCHGNENILIKLRCRASIGGVICTGRTCTKFYFPGISKPIHINRRSNNGSGPFKCLISTCICLVKHQRDIK